MPPWEAFFLNLYYACIQGTYEMSDHLREELEGGVALQEVTPRLKEPPMYKVVVHNDDFTPMDYVVHVLQVFFTMDHERATQVMLQIHTRGKGDCGVYTREIAETKVAMVNSHARNNDYPLLCTMEVA